MTNRSVIAVSIFILVAALFFALTLLAQSDESTNRQKTNAMPSEGASPGNQTQALRESAADVPKPDRHESAFSRPEDRGEDLSKLETKEIVRRLSTSEDTVEQRKAAKVLGDRAIKGTLRLEDAEQETLREYIHSQIALTASTQGEGREEAVSQIQRLWRLAAPSLIDSLGHENPTVQEAAIKNLCMMRNEQLVKDIITRVKTSDDSAFQYGAVFALGMMREKRKPLVPDRVILDDQRSKALADKVITPFLIRLQAANPDPKMQKIITNAREFLASPLDTTPKRVTEPLPNGEIKPTSSPSQISPSTAQPMSSVSQPRATTELRSWQPLHILIGVGAAIAVTLALVMRIYGRY